MSISFYTLSSFNPLWINTALKRFWALVDFVVGFNPLWINTALKQKNAVFGS